MHTCPWCTISYVNWQSQCGQCGGPLAQPRGHGPGPEPLPAPRNLPKVYVRRVRWTQNIGTLAGLGFTAIGLLFSIPMIIQKLWLPALIPAFFLLGGVSMFRYGWNIAAARLRAFRFGKVVLGEVHQVGVDATQQVNGQHPAKVVYRFRVSDQLHEGVIISFDSTASERWSGQPVWVLYNESDPAENAIFPPLS